MKDRKQKEAIIYPLFSMPLMALKVDIKGKALLNIIKDTKYRETTFSKGSYVSVSNKILENKKLKKEKKIFTSAIKMYLRILSYSKKYKILNSWTTKTLPNCMSQMHVHRNSWLSGVYYPEAHPSQSLTFSRNLPNTSFFGLDYDDPSNLYSCDEWNVQPQKDILLIFPSEIYHQINTNTSHKDRYSLSFNISPVGHFKKGTDGEIIYA
tara:strand:+ start:36 stop:662 length:627 start_codon:yes stop_codon:yes gene_type:complete